MGEGSAQPRSQQSLAASLCYRQCLPSQLLWWLDPPPIRGAGVLLEHSKVWQLCCTPDSVSSASSSMQHQFTPSLIRGKLALHAYGVGLLFAEATPWRAHAAPVRPSEKGGLALCTRGYCRWARGRHCCLPLPGPAPRAFNPPAPPQACHWGSEPKSWRNVFDLRSLLSHQTDIRFFKRTIFNKYDHRKACHSYLNLREGLVLFLFLFFGWLQKNFSGNQSFANFHPCKLSALAGAIILAILQFPLEC